MLGDYSLSHPTCLRRILIRSFQHNYNQNFKCVKFTLMHSKFTKFSLEPSSIKVNMPRRAGTLYNTSELKHICEAFNRVLACVYLICLRAEFIL